MGNAYLDRQDGCKVNSNGTIKRKNLLYFIEVVGRAGDGK